MLVAWSSSPPSSRKSSLRAGPAGWVRRVSPFESGPTPPAVIGWESARKSGVVLVGVLTVLSMLTWVVSAQRSPPGKARPAVAPAATESPAATVTAPSVIQCNPPDFPGATLPAAAGEQVTCSVTVVNNTHIDGRHQLDGHH